MRIRLTLDRGDLEPKDLAVTVDASVTVADIARQLAIADPQRSAAAPAHKLTLLVQEAFVAGAMRGQRLDPDAKLLESGLRPGSVVAIVPVSEQFAAHNQAAGPAAATLRILTGPDMGQEFSLPSGTSYIGRGRDADIRLTDPLTSKRHARILVGDSVEIVDTNSANGLVMDSLPVNRAILGSSDTVTLGDTTISVVSLHRNQSASSSAPTVDFNRSPRVVTRFPKTKKSPPPAPQRVESEPFPFIMMLLPLMMGAGIFAITQSLISVVFMAMMPLFAVGHWFEQRRMSRKRAKEQSRVFRENMALFRTEMVELQKVERSVRLQETPSVADTVDSIYTLGSLLWTHRSEHPGFLSLRFGLGTAPTRVVLEAPEQSDTEAAFRKEISETIEFFSTIDGVPIVSQLRSGGSFGVAGDRAVMDDVARGLVIQLIGLHSPAELVLTGITSAQSKDRWAWLKWLPHLGSAHSPLAGDHLAAGGAAGTALLERLEGLVEERLSSKDNATQQGRGPVADEHTSVPAPVLPSVLVIIEDDAPVDRSRLTRLVERGPDAGIHVMWLATGVQSLPAACRDFMVVDGGHGTTTAQVRLGRHSFPVSCESVDQDLATQLARMLTPVVDIGIPISDDSDLPRAVSYINLIGKDFLDQTQTIAERWKENNSVHSLAIPNRKDNGTLRALVGSKGSEPMYLDLKNEGPHALVGGTTGAGKSEFLQSWILGMAAAYSPDRLSFLFVDYKGGAAFADCVQLPHTVGLVTDLSPHLVRRALTSLRAELRHREHVLNRKKAKDLLAMQREADPDAPPYLVIIVDEFAALAAEMPEFVDGVVDVAARGRSLGVHLILATQRPAGVIKDSLRANTNLRVALRMADEDDASDILGTPLAAYFDPAIPGRAAAKTGPGRIQGFQTGYAGGWTTDQPPRPQIDVVEMNFGSGSVWEPDPGLQRPEPEPSGPNDIARMTKTIELAATSLAIAPPRKPWLAELATTYDFTRLPNPRSDDKLLIGVADNPANQEQPVVFYEPDKDGNMAIYGTGGSGKSAALRNIAVAAAVTPRGGPAHVYGIDCGSGGLKMLEGLPHVGAVISGDDEERLTRLIRWLKEVADSRSRRFADVRASTIGEYRILADAPGEERIFVLLDGIGPFRESYEYSPLSGIWEVFLQLATDGRPLGIHLIITGDRPNAVPTALLASIQRRLILRMSDAEDYLSMDAPKDVLSSASPPGRGMLDGLEVQLAVLGGTPNLALQAREFGKLREAMLRQGIKQAPGVQRLPESVELDLLPAGGAGFVTIGVDNETLGAAAVQSQGTFMLSGPPGSGRTTALVTLAHAYRRAVAEGTIIYIGSRRSSVANLPLWNRSVVGTEDAETALEELLELLQEPGKPLAFFIEGVAEFTDSLAEPALARLISEAAKANHWVVGESETSTWSSAWQLAQPFKSGRRGLLLSPSEMDGDSLLSTTLGRIKDLFVPGRGYVVARGKSRKVQVALPPEA